jgi:CBS domain-containing protein
VQSHAVTCCKITAAPDTGPVEAEVGPAAQALRESVPGTQRLQRSARFSPRRAGARLARLTDVKIRGDSCRLAHAPPGDEVFELVRESVSPVPAGGRARGHGALRRVDVHCHRGELVDGEICAACEHLLNAVPAPDGRSLRVRCMFLESDEIATQMTLARDLISISEDATLADAAVLMQERGVKQLVVVSGDTIVGELSLADLRGSGGRGRVGARARPLTVVPRTMSIAATARAFRATAETFVGVVDGATLVGVISRGDLRRAGVPNV